MRISEKTADEIRELSNYDLNKIVEKYPREEKEKVYASLLELDKRDALDEEQKFLKMSFENVENAAPGSSLQESPEVRRLLFMDPNVTSDPDAPRLYSRFAIRFFTILFSTLFGAVLLSINLYRLEKRTAIVPLLGFALVYTYLSYYLMNQVELDSTTMALVFNLIGSLVLEEMFWKRNIGKHFRFRRQSLWQALLVAALLFIFVLLGLGGMAPQ